MVLKMVICPDCGKEVVNAKFCSNCGSRLPEDEKVEIPIEEDVVEEPVVEEETVDETVKEEDVEVMEEVIDEPVEEDVVEEPTVEEEVPEEVIEDKKSKFCANCGTKVAEGTVSCPQCGYKFVQEENPQTKFCQNCGEKIDINAEICPHCGVRVAYIKSSDEKNVLLSAILSLLFPGLGHLYLGLNTKGISFIIAYIVSWALMCLLIGFILAPIVWLWALIDSIKSTESINRGVSVEDKLF